MQLILAQSTSSSTSTDDVTQIINEEHTEKVAEQTETSDLDNEDDKNKKRKKKVNKIQVQRKMDTIYSSDSDDRSVNQPKRKKEQLQFSQVNFSSSDSEGGTM